MTKRSKRTKTTKISARERLNADLLEMAQAYRGTLLREKTADKITMRILGDKASLKPEPLSPDEIRTLREEAHMSQAVFASVLNVSTGYLSQLERGARQPTGAALAMLHVIRRKGIEAVL
jgi:putative transcriptional regulator